MLLQFFAFSDTFWSCVSLTYFCQTTQYQLLDLTISPAHLWPNVVSEWFSPIQTYGERGFQLWRPDNKNMNWDPIGFVLQSYIVIGIQF